MNKRGQEYSLAIALEYGLVLLIAIGLFMYTYKAPNEERINELKVLDFSLALDSVSSLKDDISLSYDLGDGMNIKFDNRNVTMYQSYENKAKGEDFIRNSDYSFRLDDGRYENLFIVKDGNEIKVSGERVFEGFGEGESGGAGAGGGS